jgi:dipeptide/tripeptide permease
LSEARDNPDARAILCGAIAMMIGVLAVGFEEYNLGESAVLTPFLGLMVCGYVAIDQVSSRPAAS